MRTTAEFFDLINEASALPSDDLLDRIAAQQDRVAELEQAAWQAKQAVEDAVEELETLQKALQKQIKGRRA